MEINELLDKTIAIAREAGAFIRRERQSFDLNKVEHKGFNDLVSYVDKEAEKIVVSGLQEILPEAGFITEEGTINKEGEVYNWIVDPLDGTTNFVHGVPVFSVSIALMKDGEIILGVVYEVNNNECFYATKGGGAFCNDTPIGVSPTPSLSAGLVATGFPYSAFEEVDKYLGLLKDIIQHSHGVRRIGSAAVDLCYVAAGRMDGYFEYNLNSYDVAGGVIILQEAGGKVTDFSGGDDYVFGRELVGSNEKIHKELLGKVKNHW
ncbi:inositol monophosphatase family protein [Echinicola vietnamensis]|uniref:Inositol-1-monophosphatase n=1 Tax=Echinicola vietnamensis (strain DSM 17526 / LMG 23754 / KMM 6221) TaxID=926556 RepID=L0FWJ3_ECHVK|nr:inositol monophosphatase family protein [Echinicola vietnamensis]AGA77121.1 inositol monophosphatase/fructose-1,6-bisphosphatase family protein [Echinicola vietnamensis DSM 17526]